MQSKKRKSKVGKLKLSKNLLFRLKRIKNNNTNAAYDYRPAERIKCNHKYLLQSKKLRALC